ncbi:helix-turn-helix domain-containing protein [Streptomyces sp. URMC 129]|uniref:helix-turn-helix domain-containing protein n=1 Tax=Streptomyces sp. URMC 129 TaxID=3423407 RepID=UPI003F1BEB60
MEPLTALPGHVLERTDVQKALLDHDFGVFFALVRKWAGISLNRLGEACDIKSSRMSHLVRGEASITTIAKVEQIADALRIPGHLLRLAPRPWETPSRPPEVLSAEQRGDSWAVAIREMSRRLIALDNELGGPPVAELAVRAFRSVHRRLGDGDFEPRHESDIRAAAAELAEVAGWTLFDAERFPEARRFLQEALFLARLSGDRAIELLILQNMAMLSGWLGRPRDELAVARAVLGEAKLSPRAEAVFLVRAGNGLMASGEMSEGRNAFRRAHALLGEGERHGDPAWVWWITPAEIDGHHGRQLQRAGEWREAIPRLEASLLGQNGVRVGYQGIYAARLLDSYVRARSWRDAGELAESILPTVPETASARVRTLLEHTAHHGETMPGAPTGLRDALGQIRAALRADPLAL